MFSKTVLLILSLIPLIQAQNVDTCYGAGSIATSVILTLIFGVLIAAGLFHLWQRYKKKKEQHLILETDAEKGGVNDQFAFDNPGFKEANFSPSAREVKSLKNHDLSNQSSKSKWNQWSPLSVLTTASMKSEKHKPTMDDSMINVSESKMVSLKSHDFTGLGFNICGNMKEGIYIKDILHKGPASESGRLNPGDRINTVTISFEHMVYEDALTILSYASPYDVTIEASQKGQIYPNQYSGGKGNHPGHPIYRSSSFTDDLFQAKKKLIFTTAEQEDKNAGSNTSTLLKTQTNYLASAPPTEETKSENRFQKFGVRVLPQKSPKIAEQNENNSNIEHKSKIDELTKIQDLHLGPPPAVKKREKKPFDNFNRNTEHQRSNIKRDANGIPQELPGFMLDAANAVKNNRRASSADDKIPAPNEEQDLDKTPKRGNKGKAPPPPSGVENNNFDSSTENVDSTDYELHSSSLMIELGAKEMHRNSDENGEKTNRRTASTGDLFKMKSTSPQNGNTLERAQSLDITDTGVPQVISKTNESLDHQNDDNNTVRESHLSLILDKGGLSTFQRNNLKKSTDWGNLEDAILSLNDSNITTVVDVSKIDGIEVLDNIDDDTPPPVKPEKRKVKNQIWPTEELKRSALKHTSGYVQDGIVSGDKLLESRLISKRTFPDEFEPTVPETKYDQSERLKSIKSFLEHEQYSNDAPIKVPNEVKVTHVGPKPVESNQVTPGINVSNVMVNERHNNQGTTTTTTTTSLNDSSEQNFETMIAIKTPDIIKNLTITEAINILNKDVEIEQNECSTNSDARNPDVVNASESKVVEKSSPDDGSLHNTSLTYITEIKVVATPQAESDNRSVNVSEIEIVPERVAVDSNPRNLDNEFEEYVKKFEGKATESEEKSNSKHASRRNSSAEELNKIQEKVEEQLKRLPEMRCSTSSSAVAEKKTPSPPRISTLGRQRSSPDVTGGVTKSRIPISINAATKTPPTSPERRDSRHSVDTFDREILALMNAQHTVTPLAVKNVTVTAIKAGSSTRIPSGLPVLSGGGSRPPIPPRRSSDDAATLVESSFKQWVFSPNTTNERSSVTHIMLSDDNLAKKQ